MNRKFWLASGFGLLTLGLLIILGWGISGEADPEEAFRRDQRAAENGDPNAQAEVGWKMIVGLGTQKDPEGGIAYLEKVAEGGSLPARTYLGMVFVEGKEVPADRDRGMRHLEIAAAGEEPEAMMILGMRLMFKDFDALVDYKNSFDVMRGLEMSKKAGERGMKFAASQVAQFYHYQVELQAGNPEQVAEMEKERLYWTCKAGDYGREFFPEVYAQCR